MGLRRYTVFIVFIIIVSNILISAKLCGNMTCDWTGSNDECHMFYPHRGMWYYQSKYGVFQGSANVGRSNSCYKYVVKPNVFSTSCIEMERHCTDSGGALAVINSFQEYRDYNEFILDVTMVDFEPVYRKLLVTVASLPMSGLNKSCSEILVKDGFFGDNGGHIFPHTCTTTTLVNSILCEYSNTKPPSKKSICGTSPSPSTFSPTTISTRATNITMETLNANVTTPTPSSAMHPTVNAFDRKRIGIAGTTVTIISLLVTIIGLLTCMLLYIGKIKHNRRRDPYVVRAHHQIRSVHLYDSPLDGWMDKPYLVASQKETLYSNSDSTNSTNLSDVTQEEHNKDQYNTESNPLTISNYENHEIYPPICLDKPDNNCVFSVQNQNQLLKDYYNVGLTKLETLDVNIIKRIYNPLRAQPDLEIEPSVNDNGRSNKQQDNYDKLFRSSTMTPTLNHKTQSFGAGRFCKGVRRPSNNVSCTLQYTPPGAMKTAYHHLDRRCTTIGGRSRNEHDYSQLMCGSTT